MKLRRASAVDLDFLVAAVRAAESVPATGQTTYERMYGLSAPELDALLRHVLPLEGEGHPLTQHCYYILEDTGRRAATCSAWIEASDGVASSFKVAALLAGELGPEKWKAAKVAIRAFAAAAPLRTPGTLQLEMFYVPAEQRGRGLTQKLIEAVLAEFPGAPAAEISMLAGNASALRAYRKAGFQPLASNRSTDASFQTLTGSPGFVQLKKPLAGL